MFAAEEEELNVASLMEKNIIERAGSREEPVYIADLIAQAGENEEKSPDDYFTEYTDASGRSLSRFKETPEDFLNDAEENIQQIAGLMMQTLDMMITMQQNGQQ